MHVESTFQRCFSCFTCNSFLFSSVKRARARSMRKRCGPATWSDDEAIVGICLISNKVSGKSWRRVSRQFDPPSLPWGDFPPRVAERRMNQPRSVSPGPTMVTLNFALGSRPRSQARAFSLFLVRSSASLSCTPELPGGKLASLHCPYVAGLLDVGRCLKNQGQVHGRAKEHVATNTSPRPFAHFVTLPRVHVEIFDSVWDGRRRRRTLLSL